MLSVKRQKTTKSPGYAFTMREKWDFRVLKWITSRPSSFLNKDGDFDHAAFNKLGDIKRSIDMGYLEVPYAAPNNCSGVVGRVYGAGLQSVPGWVRRLCSSKYYHDVDIVNCFPVILDQLVRKLNVKAGDSLNRYISQRETILEADMELVEGLTRKQAKQQYLKVMFGSNVLDYETPFLHAFKADIAHITEHLWRLEQYRHIQNFAKFNQEKQPDVISSFLSMVIQTVEREIIDIAMKESDYKVGVYVFDGFMVEKKHGIAKLPEEYLAKLSKVVLAKSGYTVAFAEKSLEPSVEDSMKLYPPFNNSLVKSRWDADKAFNFLQKLAYQMNANPQPGNPKLFCKMLVPVMNKAFAFVMGKKRLVVERELDGNDVVKYRFRSKTSTIACYLNMNYCIKDAGKDKQIYPIKIWCMSKYVLTYKGVCCNPDVRPTQLNINSDARRYPSLPERLDDIYGVYVSERA